MTELRKAAEEALVAWDNWAPAEPIDLENKIEALRQALAQSPVDWEAVAADQAMTIAMMKVEKREWVGLMKGVRVEGDKVIIATKNNDAARELCGKLIEEKNT